MIFIGGSPFEMADATLSPPPRSHWEAREFLRSQARKHRDWTKEDADRAWEESMEQLRDPRWIESVQRERGLLRPIPESMLPGWQSPHPPMTDPMTPVPPVPLMPTPTPSAPTPQGLTPTPTPGGGGGGLMPTPGGFSVPGGLTPTATPGGGSSMPSGGGMLAPAPGGGGMPSAPAPPALIDVPTLGVPIRVATPMTMAGFLGQVPVRCAGF